MKRFWLYIVTPLLGIACLALLSMGFILGTEGGSRWLLTQIVEQSPVAISYQKVEGQLSNRLVLHNVESNWQGGSLVIDELTLAWSPWSLPFRHLTISHLSTKATTLNLTAPADESSPSPSTLRWPNIPRWLQSWQIDMEKVSLQDTHIVRPQQKDIFFKKLDLSINQLNGKLNINNLAAIIDGHRFDANAEIGLFNPAIKIKAKAITDDDQHSGSLDVNVVHDPGRRQISGPISCSINIHEQPEYRIQGTLLVAESYLKISQLQVERAALAGQVSGDVTLLLQNNLKIASEFNISDWTVPLPDQSAMVVDGYINGHGEVESHKGRFELSASGSELLHGRLGGDWIGSLKDLNITLRDSSWLGSKVSGILAWSQEQTPSVKADLSIRELDPARLSVDWTGSINLDASLGYDQNAQTERVQFNATFLDSSLRGIPLQGTAIGHWQNNDLVFNQLDLSADSFRVSAEGSLSEKIALNIDISDLGGMIPGAQGTLLGQGWVSLHDGNWLADLSANSLDLRYEKISAASANLSWSQTQPQKSGTLHLTADLVTYDEIPADRIEAVLTGDFTNHNLTLSAAHDNGSAEVSLSGQRTPPGWHGTISNILFTHQQLGTWQLTAPFSARLDDSGFELGQLQLLSSNGELSATGRFLKSGTPIHLEMFLAGVPINLFNPLVNPWSLSGTIDMTADCNKDSCNLSAEGLESLQLDDHTLTFEKTQLDGVWDETGLQVDFNLGIISKANIMGHLSSTAPRNSYHPFPMEWSITSSAIPLTGIAGFPKNLASTGTINGHIHGTLYEDLSFIGEGEATTKDAQLSWHDEDSGSVYFTIDNATCRWQWQGENLTGKLSIDMEDYGQVSASWLLPVPARWPVVPNHKGGVQGHLGGWFTENGLSGILFPEIIQDTRGDIEIDTTIKGSWNTPLLNGTIHLKNAGGYLPGPNIPLESIGLEAHFDNRQLIVDTVTVSSAPGQLTGSGSVALNGLRLKYVDFTVHGKNFTLIHLPELQLRISPDLRLSGAEDDLLLSGNIHIPTFLASGREERSPVRISPDVKVLGQNGPADQQKNLRLRTRVDLILGEDVLVKMFGLDAKLGGQVELTGIDPDHFTGNGQIYIEDGAFTTYGVKLGIEKGRASYAGGPLDNPAIDILALKNVGEATVGVQILGTAKTPSVKLYSKPEMADTDILSLIVLGRPLNQAGGETDPLMLAAGALLSTGDSAVLRNSLQNQLGIDTLEAESETGQATDTVLRLGKYLTPDIYLSYGYALFGQRSEVGLRYHIYRGWEAESKFGVESGADLYYRFDFE